MSLRITAILAFIASTVIPFIQEVLDFIESLKKGSYSSSKSAALSSLADECIKTIMDESGKEKKLENYTQPVASKRTESHPSPWSRFIGRD